MPTLNQMEKLAAADAVGGDAPRSPAVGPGDTMPPEHWQCVLEDVAVDARPSAPSIRTQRLSQIEGHLLRVTCSKCSRIVEIQKVDAVRLYGPDAVWKDVGQRLLDNTCQVRTGRHEEDGCWPAFD